MKNVPAGLIFCRHIFVNTGGKSSGRKSWNESFGLTFLRALKFLDTGILPVLFFCQML